MVNYQVVVNLVVFILAISFPIALIFQIAQKIIGIFIRAMWGKDVSF